MYKSHKPARLVDGPRTSNEDARDIFENRAKALKGLLTYYKKEHTRKIENGEVDAIALEDTSTTDGLMYYSRLGKAQFLGRLENMHEDDKMNRALRRGTSMQTKKIEYHSDDEMSDKKNTQLDSPTSESKLADLLGQPSSIASAETMAKVFKRRKFALSLATLASKPEKIIQITKDGAIQAVMELAAIPDLVIQKSCASAFSILAKEPRIRSQMNDKGAIPCILALSATPNTFVKLECCRALCNLMCYSPDEGRGTYESKAVRDGMAYVLLRMCIDCPQAIPLALQCLLNLTVVKDKYPRIEEVTDTLLQLEGRESLDQTLQVYVAQCLCNMSALKSNQQRLLEDGCMPFLEKMLKDGTDELRVYASTVLRNLTTCYRTRPKLLDHNIVGLLVSMSRDPLDEVKFLAVKSLYNLSRDATCRERIVAGNAVTVILKISSDTSNIAIGRLAAKTLRVLCGDASVAHTLVGDGIVKALMSLLKDDDSDIRQYCAESICSLFQMDKILGRLIEQGAVGVIVALSQSSKEYITREWCSFALYYLSTNKVCPEETLELGIVPCLIRLCDESSPKTKYFCSAAFAYVTLLKNIDTSGAIQVLVHMLEHETDIETRNNCIASLYNLADLDENCFAMLLAGSLQPILQLTDSENLETKIKCAAIVCRLSLQEEFYDEFQENNVLEILLRLSAIDHTLTQRRVIIAISNLSSSADLRKQLLDLNPIPYILKLASKRDENLRRGCVSIVCNLSSEHKVEKRIIDGDYGPHSTTPAPIVNTLLITAMISSDQIQTKVICVKALINLMADKTLYNRMVETGVIWGFSSLATENDPMLLHLSAKALCCLSKDFAKEMLESNATIKTSIYLISLKDDIEMQRLGGRILVNLLTHEKRKAAAFRKYVVKNMIPLVEATDDDCNEMAILLLCSLSSYEDCTDIIVESGMLRIIDAGATFNHKSLAVAYLTMFGNIANSGGMRIKILNERSLDKMRQICMQDDPSIDLTVIKTIYSLSCALENLPKLCEYEVISLLEMLWMNSTPEVRTEEYIYYLVASLYNLTVDLNTQAKVVSSGLVGLLMELWPEAKKQSKSCILASKAVLNLGCGNVNTCRLVTDGAATVLTFISDRKKGSEYQNYPFNYEMIHRTSACLRNILSVQSNQKTMVSSGCLISLMEIAHQSEKSIHGSDPLTSFIQKNVLSAFRSMTFNAEVRDHLKECGAIDFIMHDLTKEDTTIGYNLLVELEAESWCNNARGTMRDGRAAVIQPYPVDEALLRPMDGEGEKSGDDTGNTLLIFDEILAEASIVLEKFHVQVELDEPELDIEFHERQLAFGIDSLESIKDPENTSVPVLCMCPKKECEVFDKAIRYLKMDALEEAKENDIMLQEFEEVRFSANGSIELSKRKGELARLAEANEIINTSGNNSKANSRTVSRDDFEGGGFPDVIKTDDSITSYNSKPGSARKPSRSKPGSRNSSRPGTRGGAEATFTDDNDGLPNIEGASSVSWGKGESQELAVIDDLKTRTQPRKETPAEKFDKLVSFIKASKQSPNQLPIDQVVDEWTKLSRF